MFCARLFCYFTSPTVPPNECDAVIAIVILYAHEQTRRPDEQEERPLSKHEHGDREGHRKFRRLGVENVCAKGRKKDSSVVVWLAGWLLGCRRRGHGAGVRAVLRPC